MRLAVLVAMLAAVFAGSAYGGQASSSTDLRITVWPNGPGKGSRVWTLRCNPTGGTLPRTTAACRRLALLRRPFAPIPSDTVCTQIYGGPAQAVVTGTHQGARVWVRLALRNGCEIGRWQTLSFLTPGVAPGGSDA